MYRAGVQDAPQEMERNKAAAKQSRVRPTTQLLLTLPPFPEGHSAHEHSILKHNFALMSTKPQEHQPCISGDLVRFTDL